MSEEFETILILFYFIPRLVKYVYQSVNLLAVGIALVLIDADDWTGLVTVDWVELLGLFVVMPKLFLKLG